jgi:hypothetical protein
MGSYIYKNQSINDVYTKPVVCSEIRTKQSTQSENHVKFLMLNLVVRKETTTL